MTRKTGLTLADTGIRDENGLEPMDHLFSSPEKSTKAKKLNGTGRNANATISSEEDMDLAESERYHFTG
jgi:centromere protein C